MRQWEVAEWVNGWACDGVRHSSRLGKKRKSQAGRREQQAPKEAACNAAMAWVALDDDESLVEDARFKALCAPRTVLTDSREGLTDTDADRAIAILHLSLQYNHDKEIGSITEASSTEPIHSGLESSNSVGVDGAPISDTQENNEVSQKSKVAKKYDQPRRFSTPA